MRKTLSYLDRHGIVLEELYKRSVGLAPEGYRGEAYHQIELFIVLRFHGQQHVTDGRAHRVAHPGDALLARCLQHVVDDGRRVKQGDFVKTGE